MGDGTNESPYTREDVLRLVEEKGGRAQGLDLSEKAFQQGGINLANLNLKGIILKRVWLVGARLERTNLKFANLEEADLTGADFSGANLEHANLGEANLVNAKFERANLSYANFKDANLLGANLQGANLTGAQLQDAILLSANLQKTSLWKVELSANTKLGLTTWGNYILGEEINGHFYIAEETYRRLKQWYTNAGMYDIAAKFYYREKEVSRKSLKWRSKHRLALEASHIFFGYGEKWWNILLWMTAVVFGLAGVYHLWGSFNSSSFLDTLYYSASSFTALGYGNWAPEPTGWAKYVGAIEAFMGVSMMALLLVTFVRKWTR